MDKSNAIVEQASKISTYAIYDSLTEISELKAVLTVDKKEKTYTQTSKLLFDKLDALAEIINDLHPSELSESLLLIRRISVSPTKKYQLWVINDQAIVFTKSEAWRVFNSVLFLEGELFIKKVIWDENARIVCISMFYIVYEEYVDYKVSFAENTSNEVNGVDVLDGKDSLLDTMMAYSEVWTILNCLEDEYAARVPQKVKNFFEEERLKEYEPQIDVDKPLTEQNLQRETMVLLAMLNINYWCNNEEEREFYLRKMARNDNKKYDPNNTSWDLGRIFDLQEGMDSKNNDEYLTKCEEDHHIVIRMPFGDYCLFVDRSYCAPRSMFVKSENNDEEDAMEFYLFNSWGPRLKVTNINIQDLNVCSSQSKTTPLQKGNSIFISEEEKIIDQDGRTIVSFSTPDGWILEEWTDEGW